MAEHFMGLLQILEQVDSFKLKPEAANGLIKGVVMIISIMTNAEQLAEAVVTQRAGWEPAARSEAGSSQLQIPAGTIS